MINSDKFYLKAIINNMINFTLRLWWTTKWWKHILTLDCSMYCIAQTGSKNLWQIWWHNQSANSFYASPFAVQNSQSAKIFLDCNPPKFGTMQYTAGYLKQSVCGQSLVNWLVMHWLFAKYQKSAYQPHFYNIGNRFFIADFWQIIK